MSLEPLYETKPLTKKKKEFIKAFVRCGDAHKAYLSLGYPKSAATKSRAMKLRRDLAPQIQEELGNYVTGVDMAILAVNVIADLAENGKTEATRLAAAKEVLSRGGWDAPKEVTVNHVTKNLTNAEIDKRIKELNHELNPVSIQ